jgi:phospholipid/cholesterol/gamma-HCH transport system substrate-binding protein
MESDKHYFIEGLFIIGFTIAAAVFAVWLGSPGRHDDVLYRIHFPDSVSGLALGDTVKFRGVDVGTVKTMSLDRDNPQLVQVDGGGKRRYRHQGQPRAKGITGVSHRISTAVTRKAQTLVAATPAGSIPEIPTEKTGLKAMIDELPKMVSKIETTADKFAGMADKFGGMATKFSAVGDQTKHVMQNVDELTEKVKENPSLLLRRPKEKDKKEEVSRR